MQQIIGGSHVEQVVAEGAPFYLPDVDSQQVVRTLGLGQRVASGHFFTVRETYMLPWQETELGVWWQPK